jgi:hypothetical protein
MNISYLIVIVIIIVLCFALYATSRYTTSRMMPMPPMPTIEPIESKQMPIGPPPVFYTPYLTTMTDLFSLPPCHPVEYRPTVETVPL